MRQALGRVTLVYIFRVGQCLIWHDPQRLPRGWRGQPSDTLGGHTSPASPSSSPLAWGAGLNSFFSRDMTISFP